jgi:uncharacterized OB-fold protein
MSTPLPDVEWELTREFWAAAEREELVIPRCAGCDRYVWYPEPSCPECGGSEIPWVRVSGRGTLFTWSIVVHPLYRPFAEKLPYTTGIVALEEEPRVRLVTTIVDCDADDLVMEMPMRVAFRPLEFPGVEDRVVAPHFAPA